MKIGVYGNCQVRSIADGIRHLVPDATIYNFGVNQTIAADPKTRARTADTLADCDLVFFQPGINDYAEGLTPDDMKRRCKRLAALPILFTRSLQPDCHYVYAPGGGLIQGPLGPYQSAIIAGAYLKGLSERRAATLFNVFTYRKLGFLDEKITNQRLIAESAKLNYVFDAYMQGRNGRFMHTINHPSINILLETAAQALHKAGVTVKGPDPKNNPPQDWLANGPIWPIYPGIAPAFETPDEPFLFRNGQTGISLSLPEFVTASYRAYSLLAGPFTSALIEVVEDFIDAYVVT